MNKTIDLTINKEGLAHNIQKAKELSSSLRWQSDTSASILVRQKKSLSADR